MPHRLDPLLAPRSIAIVGASPTPHTPGNYALGSLRAGGYDGALHLINPKYADIDGHPCVPSLSDVKGPIDLAVLLVSNARIEDALRAAIDSGARAAAVYASCLIEGDGDPPLVRRLADLARDARIPMLGGNCLGFYDDVSATWLCIAPPTRQRQKGEVAIIAHAGAVMSAFAHTRAPLAFNLLVSAGQELATTAADYLDYALERPETKVVGLFLETVRDPEGFAAALAKANRKGVPVVAVKVGRTEASAAMAISHSGAIAGDDGAYAALFDHYGVARVASLDDMLAALQWFAQGRRAAMGGLVTIQESGGERELQMDLASDAGVPYATIAPATRDRLARHLDFGLEPVNPLDAWGTGRDYETVFAECFDALLQDPDAALGLMCNDLREGNPLCEGFIDAAARVAARTSKPVAVATSYSHTSKPAYVERARAAGLPILDGIESALEAARRLMDRRDFLARKADPPPALAPGRWPERLRQGPLSDLESFRLLEHFGVPVIASHAAGDQDGARAAALSIGYPVALKSSVPGLAHKTEQGGVHLNLRHEADLIAAYRDLAARLGPTVLVSRMVPAGVEIALGLIPDRRFGPVVMVGAGGVMAESFKDALFALAPFGPRTAERLLRRLRLAPLLGAWRGRAAIDMDAAARAISAFSAMAATLSDTASEIDVNPLIATAQGAFAVDALILPRGETGRRHHDR